MSGTPAAPATGATPAAGATPATGATPAAAVSSARYPPALCVSSDVPYGMLAVVE